MNEGTTKSANEYLRTLEQNDFDAYINMMHDMTKKEFVEKYGKKELESSKKRFNSLRKRVDKEDTKKIVGYKITYQGKTKDFVDREKAAKFMHVQLRKDIISKMDPIYEGTTSKNPSLDYEKDGDKLTPAPKFSLRDYAVSDDDIEDLEDIDPQYNDGKTRPRTESVLYPHNTMDEAKMKLSNPEKHQLKIAKSTLKMSDAGANIMGGMNKEQGRTFLKGIGYSDKAIKKLEEGDTQNLEKKSDDLLYDDEECDIEIDEANYSFKKNQSVSYKKKTYTVKDSNKDYVELEDNRGFTQLIYLDDIKSFKNNTILTEQDLNIVTAELKRYARAAGIECIMTAEDLYSEDKEVKNIIEQSEEEEEE